MAIPSSGLKLLLNVNDVDGVGNALLEDGFDVTKWVATGVNPFKIVNTTYGYTRRKPKFKSSSQEKAVAFDGVYNLLTSPGSGTALNFLHQTGVFDCLLVFRRVAPSIGSATRNILGNAGAASPSNGLLVQTLGGGATEGQIRIALRSGGGLAAFIDSSTAIRPVIGAPFVLLIRGTGTELQISHDFMNFESSAISGLNGASVATEDWSVGGNFSTEGATLSCFGGDFLSSSAVAIANRNWTDTELASIKADLEAELGTDLI